MLCFVDGMQILFSEKSFCESSTSERFGRPLISLVSIVCGSISMKHTLRDIYSTITDVQGEPHDLAFDVECLTLFLIFLLFILDHVAHFSILL